MNVSGEIKQKWPPNDPIAELSRPARNELMGVWPAFVYDVLDLGLAVEHLDLFDGTVRVGPLDLPTD